MPMTTGELIAKYILLRDKKAEITERHKEELAPYNDLMFKLETCFQQAMDKDGLDSLHAPDGTAYKSEQSSVTVADWGAFLDWVKETGSWHMLEQRAAKSAVTEMLSETSALPPGVNIKRSIKINVRRSS